MTRSRTILLAFTGKEINQAERVSEIDEGYECWNFKKFDLDSFVVALQAKIPPVNKNVLGNYKAVDEHADFGITETAFKECSWGLLIPDGLDDSIAMSYGEPLFLINLYSPVFLYPLFHAGDFGITRLSYNRRLELLQDRNQSHRIATKEFVGFFKTLLSQSQYCGPSMDRATRWSKEDWRLCMTGMLFSRLQDYDGGKSAFGWQRESADMGTILESLLTAGDRREKKIEGKLKRRIAALLSHRFPSIENEIKELYEKRSSFVHGRFFAEVADDIARNPDDLPSPDFELLRRHRERVRWAIVAYLHLAQVLKSSPNAYPGMKSVIDVLEKASGDSQVRKRVIRDVNEVLALLDS